MLKDMLIGLSIGMVAGAVAVKKCKPCANAVDAMCKPLKDMKKEDMLKCESKTCCD